MDVITGWLSNTFISAMYNPAAQALKDAYNNDLAARVSDLSSKITGPINTRITELENTPGVSADTIASLKDLSAGALKTAQNPSTSLSTISSATPSITARFNYLNQEAITQAAEWQQDQYTKANEIAAQQTADQSFNIYRLWETMKSVFIKYIWYIILVSVALLGGSLMSNRAIFRGWGFRLYYFVYGTIIFPLSYFIAIKDYFMRDDRHLPKFFAILAPLLNRKNHSAVTRVLFFPFVYNHPTDVEAAVAEAAGAIAAGNFIATPATPATT